jgi:hypothetical protein
MMSGLVYESSAISFVSYDRITTYHIPRLLHIEYGAICTDPDWSQCVYNMNQQNYSEPERSFHFYCFEIGLFGCCEFSIPAYIPYTHAAFIGKRKHLFAAFFLIMKKSVTRKINFEVAN